MSAPVAGGCGDHDSVNLSCESATWQQGAGHWEGAEEGARPSFLLRACPHFGNEAPLASAWSQSMSAGVYFQEIINLQSMRNIQKSGGNLLLQEEQGLGSRVTLAASLRVSVDVCGQFLQRKEP